jgi:hypothetical protein
MILMENFREFSAGPDPFGRTWHAQFKYLQTGISIRHSDSVDVCWMLDNGDEKVHKVVVIANEALRAYSKRTGRTISDPWCARIALCKLKHAIDTAEDMEREYLAVTPGEIEEYDAKIKRWEDELGKHAA